MNNNGQTQPDLQGGKAQLTANPSDNIKDYILSLIDVSKYSNMRDLNKKIKKVFVELIFSQKGYI